MPELETNFVTVVSGLPRSGTSMMMRMLESGGLPIVTDGIRAADKDNPNGYFEFEPVKRLDKDSSWLPEAYGKALKVIYIFLYNLPANHSYKVLFIRRSLDEVIASQKVMLRARQEEGGRLSDQQLMESFDLQLQKLYAWLKRQPNFATLYLDHHQVLNNPERTAAEVTSFLGLPLNQEAMIQAVDRSLHRNKTKAD